jgi:D-lactate dehydrogenase
MAPFVEKEWGEAAFGLMKAIKNLFDPKGLLNPGVIINSDLEAHVKNLKPLPATHELVDKCIECGFCEPICPSKHLTFTPRQRIAGRREISRRMVGGRGEAPLKKLVRSYRYQGMNTCAADGLCSTLCPVGIDTGKMIKALREEAHGQLANRVADWTADHFKPVAGTAAGVLNTVDRLHKLTGTPFMETVTAAAHTGTAGVVPQWNRAMPTGSGKIKVQAASTADPLAMVYFPSCASRAMGGPAREESERRPLPQQTLSVLEKAGCAVILPDNLGSLCCGQAFESKGFREQADRKAEELSAALLLASRDGALPILCDTSPCLMRMRNTLDKRLQLFEPVEFVLQFLKDRLQFTRKDAKIALHATCSTRKMGLDTKLRELALLCATEVVVPENIFCCGFAGDRGFNFPELNESALHGLADQVHGCEAGYSTSKTCEVGLTLHGHIPYRSIFALVDEVTSPLAR